MKIGRTRIKLAEKLRALGLVIEPEDLISAQGYHRINGVYNDTYIWEAYCTAGDNFEFEGHKYLPGSKISICSYNRMRDCVKGFSLYWDSRDLRSELEVFAETDSREQSKYSAPLIL